MLLCGLLLTLGAICLIFPSLGVPYLWEDEAETAVLARNLLSHGFPTPWDGEHLVTQQAGRDFIKIGDQLVWTWHPWLQHYVCAASFALFGEGTKQARLPFALIGLASVPLFYAWRLRRQPAGAAAITTLLYVTSLTFLLFTRQCRYYPLLFLAGVLVWWHYETLVWGAPDKQKGRWWKLGLALALLFYSNSLSAVGLVAGLLVHSLLIRRASPAAWHQTLKACALFFVLALPWICLMVISEVGIADFSLGERWLLLVALLWGFQYSMLPAALWPVQVWMFFRWRGRFNPEAVLARREMGLLTVVASSTILIVLAVGPVASMRYLLALWPLCAAVLGALWAQLNYVRPWIGATLIGLLLLSNWLQALPVMPLALAGYARVEEKPLVNLEELAEPDSFLVEYIEDLLDVNPPQPLREAIRTQMLHVAQLGLPTSPLLLYAGELAYYSQGPVEGMLQGATLLGQDARLIVTNYDWESLNFYLRVPVGLHPGEQETRKRFGLPALDLARTDLLIPRDDWRKLPAEITRTGKFVLLPIQGPDYQFENLPDYTLHRFGVQKAPPLKVYARESRLLEQLKEGRNKVLGRTQETQR